MDVITSPRGSARCGKEWSCRAESIFALKGINLKIVHSEAVHCYMGYFETYILPIIFFMYGGILSLTYSHLYHYWHFPTMVGFCHGGNLLGNRNDMIVDYWLSLWHKTHYMGLLHPGACLHRPSLELVSPVFTGHLFCLEIFKWRLSSLFDSHR